MGSGLTPALSEGEGVASLSSAYSLQLRTVPVRWPGVRSNDKATLGKRKNRGKLLFFKNIKYYSPYLQQTNNQLIMKKFTFLALAAIALVSCNNDDDSSDVSLAGTWKLTSMTTPYPWDLNNDGTAGNDIVSESGCMDNSTIVFSGGTGVDVKMQSVDIEGDEGDYTVTCSEPETENGTYTVSGDDVTITVDGQDIIFIKSGKKLTASEQGSTLVFTKQ